MFENSTFVISNTDIQKCPKPDRPEIAFIGRSNVGKSSLINMLAARKGLAKTSSKPGKTQLINHFNIDDRWYLVDLPGYGYAKVSKKSRSAWEQMISDYILLRENLKVVCVLIDSRLDPQRIDLDFINWLGENEVPMVLIFTKADKQSINKGQQNIAKFKRAMSATWDAFPPIFLSSAETAIGKDKIIEFLQEVVES